MEKKLDDIPTIYYDDEMDIFIKNPLDNVSFFGGLLVGVFGTLLLLHIFTATTAHAYMWDMYSQNPTGQGPLGVVTVSVDMSIADNEIYDIDTYCVSKGVNESEYDYVVGAWTASAWDYETNPFWFTATRNGDILTSTISGIEGDIVYVSWGCGSTQEISFYDENIGGMYYIYVYDQYIFPYTGTTIFTIIGNNNVFFGSTANLVSSFGAGLSTSFSSIAPILGVILGLAVALLLIPQMIEWFKGAGDRRDLYAQAEKEHIRLEKWLNRNKNE